MNMREKCMKENGKMICFMEKEKISWTNGDTYEGDFENNIAHGVKMYLIRKDQTYEGELKNGKRNGRKNTFSSGNFYEGEWKDNKHHGKGKNDLY